MSTYIVTFEINDSKRIKDFTEKLMTFSRYCPIHKNAWAINSDLKANEICDSLSSVLNQTDRVFVIRSGTEAAWFNLYGIEYTDWLKKLL